MISNNISVFLSCSFAPDDAIGNELVRGICAGVGMSCVNVSAGFSALPPEKAREYIAHAAGVIAIATKRDRLESGEFIMPSAVREEIAIAYGLGKPILIIGEDGVRFDGFMVNYGTRLPFKRDELTHPSFIEKLVFSIYTFRQAVASSHATIYQYATEYISENTRHLVALDFDGSSYWWTVAVTKHLLFKEALLRDIAVSVWPPVPLRLKIETPLPEWNIAINSSSRPFEIETVLSDIAPERVDFFFRFKPVPQPGDYIEYTRTFKSQYMNPLFVEDLPEGMPPYVIINGRSYAVHDGVIPVERTKKLHAHYTFPAEYGLRADDVAVFVASHSLSIDYLAPWEQKRVAVDIESFGLKLIVDLRVEDPLPRHMYGLAWSPPPRPHRAQTHF